MYRLIVVTLVGLAPLAGCSAPPPGHAPPPDLMPVAAGEMSVLMLTDGQDDTLVAGAQGGFHVWMQYAVRGVAAGTYSLERSAHRVSDGAVVLVYRGDVDVGAPDADGWWTAPSAIPMFMCPTPIGISIVGVPIDFTLRLSDAGAGADAAARAAADITLVPRCPADQLDFCTRICTG